MKARFSLLVMTMAAIGLWVCVNANAGGAAMKITSPAFDEGGNIPAKYTCDGKNINPPLHIEGVPTKTKSLVLIMDDPDAPLGTWNHWLLWNIDPGTSDIAENSVPLRAIQGNTDFGVEKYGGPSPPSGVHRYFFKLYALNTKLSLPVGSTRSALDGAINNHIVARAELIGRYSRK